MIFHYAEEKFITSATGEEQSLSNMIVRVAHCVYLAAKVADHTLLPVIVRRTTRIPVPLDLAFIVYSIDQRRRETVAKKDGGQQEISHKLKEVSAVLFTPFLMIDISLQNQEVCKKWIKAFWSNLAKEEELGSLPGTSLKSIGYLI